MDVAFSADAPDARVPSLSGSQKMRIILVFLRPSCLNCTSTRSARRNVAAPQLTSHEVRQARPLTVCASAISHTSVGKFVRSDPQSRKADLNPCALTGWRSRCSSIRKAMFDSGLPAR